MKKYLAILLALVMVLGLCACGSSKTEAPAADSAPAAEASSDSVTLTAGKLAVGVEIGYPPMEYFDEDGSTPIGFDIELMAAVADKMGLELEIVDTAWDGIFAGLESNKYDFIMSSCSITPARQKSYLMGNPYVQNAIELLVPVDSAITGIDDVAGKSVAVQGETSSHDYLRDNDTGCEIKDYDKVINCFDELKLGRVDAVLTDSVVAAYYLGDDINNYKVVWVNSEAEPIGVTYKKGNQALFDAVEAVLDELAKEGTTAKIAATYFGDSSGVDGLR